MQSLFGVSHPSCLLTLLLVEIHLGWSRGLQDHYEAAVLGLRRVKVYSVLERCKHRLTHLPVLGQHYTYCQLFDLTLQKQMAVK